MRLRLCNRSMIALLSRTASETNASVCVFAFPGLVVRDGSAGAFFQHSADEARTDKARTVHPVMARASVLRSRAPAVGLSGDLLLSGSLSKALDSPTSPSTHASHSIPRDLANGWHSTVGRAPRGGQLTKLGALFIILATPPTAAFTCVSMFSVEMCSSQVPDCSLLLRRIWWSCFGDELGTVTGGLSKLLEDPGRVHDMFPTVTARSIFFVVAYAAFEAALCLFMPGREFRGPVTAAGNRPRYKVRA